MKMPAPTIPPITINVTSPAPRRRASVGEEALSAAGSDKRAQNPFGSDPSRYFRLSSFQRRPPPKKTDRRSLSSGSS